MELIVMLLWIVVLIVGIVCIISVCKKDVSVPDTTIYLTEEEMKARPVVASIHIQETEVPDIANEAAVLPEKDKKIVYDFIPLEDDMQILMQELCEEYHVGFAFCLAVMESESAFSIDCQGDKQDDGTYRSVGLMQINKPNWNRYDLNASVPKDNIEIGIRMLSELIVKYQDTDKVVMAYKGGEAAMQKWVDEGFRLKACDDIVISTMWWQERLDNYE